MKQIEKKADIARREPPEGLIEGRNAVLEALRSGRTIDHVFLAEGDTDRALSRLAGMAREAGAVVKTADRRKLDAMSPTGAHQASSPSPPPTPIPPWTRCSPRPSPRAKRRCSSSATS